MPMTYKMSLLLDASLQGPDKSIKDDANKLMEAMYGNGSAPKFIEFSWGSVTLPKAAPVSITIRYALFRPNGEPVRAFVDLELAQAEDTNPPGQGTEPDDAGDQPDFARTPCATATRCRRSPTTPTATRRGGGRSPRPTGSTTRCVCGAAAS